MPFLADIGNAIIQAATGTNVSELQAQAAAAEQQLTIAVGTMIALQAFVAVELFVIMVIVWKERH